MSSSEQEGPLLTGGALLKDRWEILRKIGRGGFGEIYRAKDLDTGERCAVKVESAVSTKQVLKMEVVVLKRLQSYSPHICTLLGCGRTDKINYMVMTLLGPNLSELRKQQSNQRFSLSTTLRVGVQVIAAVRAMHGCGFLHRDIKPSNFAIGAASATKQTCYMLDFGLARQFVTSSGELRPPRPVAGFRGTVRYASINAHQSKDLGRHDDLWSVFYLLMELANGELPWKKIRDKDKAGKYKLSFDHKRLLKHLPAEFHDFLDHLKSLDYFLEPDYMMLSTLLQNAIRYLGIKRGDPLDWEQDPSLQSVTTVSAGSAPALQTNQNTARGKQEAERKGGDSRTNVSTEDCMSQNSGGRKDNDVVRKHSSREENGRIRSTRVGGIVHSKRHKQLNLLQQRRSMPPSPLLQATHLVNHNDSGLLHTNSLDRFFDMRAGEGSHTPHQSSARSQSPQKNKSAREEIVEKEMVAENLPEGKSVSEGVRERGREETSKSKSLSTSSESDSEDEGGPELVERDKERSENVPGLAEAGPGLDEAIKSQVPLKACGSDFRPESLQIHPETTPPPLQLGYTRQDGGSDRERRGEASSPSESSCFKHRLFALTVQNRSEPAEDAEQVPLVTIPKSRGRDEHSPGPPPLGFHEPQRMWGHDASKPLPLVETQVGGASERGGKSEMNLPRPPDHPPPRHYTLLASRRRRFRRPRNT